MYKKSKSVVYLDINEVSKLQNKKIIIYGAGLYGTLLFSFLDVKGLKDNVICFAVSDKNENQTYLFGKQVLQFEDIDLDKITTTTIIIVAMKDKKADIVIEKMKQQNISNLYWFNSYQKAKQEMEWAKFVKYCNKPIQKNKVLFYCYEGLGYHCNCKYIAEKLLEENYPVNLVWVLTNVEDGLYMPKSIKTVKIDTEEYYKELYTSSIIIENSGKDIHVYKRKGQFCINTWHGYGPFKKVNAALPEYDVKTLEEYYSYYDLFITASRFYSQVYKESFCYKGEVLECGAPRNDIFFTNNKVKERIYELYSIPADKKIILFAPTFRYDKTAAFDKYNIDMNRVLRAMKNRFGDDYVLMYRFHHVLYKSKERIDYFETGIDVTLYPDIQELLVAADVVITDYSSLMWDFSLQRKPVFLYQSDAEEYENNRGFYAPISEWPYPHAHTQDELLEIIQRFDYEKYIEELNVFLEKYGTCDDGYAAERVVKRIMDIVER